MSAAGAFLNVDNGCLVIHLRKRFCRAGPDSGTGVVLGAAALVDHKFFVVGNGDFLLVTPSERHIETRLLLGYGCIIIRRRIVFCDELTLKLRFRLIGEPVMSNVAKRP